MFQSLHILILEIVLGATSNTSTDIFETWSLVASLKSWTVIFVDRWGL